MYALFINNVRQAAPKELVFVRKINANGGLSFKLRIFTYKSKYKSDIHYG